MSKPSKEDVVWMKLSQILEANFHRRLYADHDFIEIKPQSQKNHVIGLLIMAVLVMSPYLLMLLISLGDFRASMVMLPLCGIFLIVALYFMITTSNYDNYINLNVTDKTLYIENRFLWFPYSRRLIRFDAMDSFYHTEKTSSGDSPDENILSVRLKNGLTLTVQEFGGAEKTSHLLNDLLALKANA